MKRIVTGVVLAALFLSIAGMGMAASNKPSNGPPDLQKVTFVHYAKSDSAASKPTWDDSSEIYKLMYGGIKWESTMTYEVNTYGSELDEDDVMSVLGDSLETWDDAITSDFELFAPPELNITAYYVSGNGVNTVTWDTLPYVNAIAVNSFWYSPATKVIVESDVVFSTDYTWADCEASDAHCNDEGYQKKMDLENIATHEFGHNGLNDLYMPPSVALTMHGYSDFGETDKQTLGTGDILGIQALYGSST